MPRAGAGDLHHVEPYGNVLAPMRAHVDPCGGTQTAALVAVDRLHALARTPGRAVVSVVHDLSLAKAFGTRALLLDHGKTAAMGPVGEVLCPEKLDGVYNMDVSAWMRKMLGQWE